MNRVALDALAAKRDLSGIVGSLEGDDAARIEKEILLQRRIDPELWRAAGGRGPDATER